jgi:antitoxin component YwqK of YwqJK toxin-antitoxin module
MKYIFLVLIITITSCKKNDLQMIYYPSGALKMKIEVKDKLYHGKAYEYYENGKLKFEANYRDGLLQGTSLTYYENGNVMEEKKWVNGKLHGLTTGFYENGKVKSKIFFLKNNRTGEAEFLYENGILKATIPYSDNKIKGKLIEYHDNGMVSLESCVGTIDTVTNVTLWSKKFDRNGALIDKYHIVEVTSAKEPNTENYKLNIKLDGARYEKITVFIGSFDENYSYTGGRQDTIYSNNLEASYIYKPEKAGKHIIRGKIQDYKEGQIGKTKTLDDTYAYFTYVLDIKPNTDL